MNAVKIISTEIDELRRRLVKFLRFGKNDVQTAIEAAPYGVDSHPVKDMIALYAPTTQNGKSVIVGYLNKNQLAEVGELRLFSTNTQGDEQAYVWLRSSGDIELNGDTDNLIRYSKLSNRLNTLVSDINAELAEIAIGISAAGGAYTPVPIAIDISDTKIDNLKTS